MSQKSIILKRHAKRAFEILTRQGPKAFFKKLQLYFASRRDIPPAPNAEEKISFRELDETPLSAPGSLAVHLHLYYDDLAPEFAASLKNIPIPFDLYISVRSDLSEERMAELAALFGQAAGTGRAAGNESGAGTPAAGKVTIRRSENRGRDIAPMYVLFGKELSSYDFVLHMHSKKSLYTGSEQMGWRQYSVSSLIGSPDAASRLLKLIAGHPDIGLVYPKRYPGMVPEAYGWLANEKKGKEFLDSLGIPFRNTIFLYPAGSFFLVRNAAIRQIWDRKLSYLDFDEEKGQTDGTLAHVLERAISRVAAANGFRDAIADASDESFHIGADRDTFAPVFRRDPEYLDAELMSADVVSFDVFDTLLTRKYLEPSDLFAAIPAACGFSKIASEDFRKIRMEAEGEAMRQKKAFCSLSDIYDTLQGLLHLSAGERDALENAELALEKDTLLPRRDMAALFRALADAGKNIILVSDMYLPRSFYEDVLKENGLEGYERLYLSCEEGLRKDDGSLWEKVYADFPDRVLIHVGDNQRSDWQVLSDRGGRPLWIMSPAAEAQIAGIDALSAALSRNAPSLIRGLFRNGGLFNSPFALSKDGQARLTDSYAMGYSVFGPLFYEYMAWLQENTPKDAVLAFLAREGYLFEQIYELFAGNDAKDHLYLLTSRRAVSVAAVRSEEDIREILRRAYDGTLKNLLESRLGASPALAAGVPDRQVHIADPASGERDDYDKVMNAIAPLLPELIKNAAEERETYLSYLDSVLPEEKRKKAVLVDIGYSGTIQYHMAKLLQEPVKAAYLAVFDLNPGLPRLGCEVFAMYGKEKSPFADSIKKTLLFLECALSAPYGQLLRFEKNGQPDYRNDALPSDGIRFLQDGILSYCRDRASAENLSGQQSVPESRAFMEETYTELLVNHNYLKRETASLFTVEDRYSQDTCLHLNPDTHQWEI